MSNKNQLAMVKKDTVDVVASKVREFQERGEVHFPAGYSPENAMKSAWLVLQETKDRNNKPALEVCTRDSVANALLDMVVQGLNPQKNQGYFIVYGNRLTFQRSYFGTMAVTKRVTGAKSIDARVIYDGDDVDYDITNGRITNLSHKQKFGNINKDKIVGAYATIVLDQDDVYYELMTIDEIRQAWMQSPMWAKGQEIEKAGSTHEKFRQEMAQKTVINRACKKFLNSSDDGSLMMKHINNTDEIAAETDLEEELLQNANAEIIDVEYESEEVGDKQEEEPEDEIAAPEDVEDQQINFDKTGTDGPNW